MSKKQVSVYVIIVSLIAAGAILISSKLWPDSSQTIMYFIIAIWFIPFTWLSGKAAGKKSE